MCLLYTASYLRWSQIGYRQRCNSGRIRAGHCQRIWVFFTSWIQLEVLGALFNPLLYPSPHYHVRSLFAGRSSFLHEEGQWLAGGNSPTDHGREEREQSLLSWGRQAPALFLAGTPRGIQKGRRGNVQPGRPASERGTKKELSLVNFIVQHF